MNKRKANMSIMDAIYKRCSVRSYSPERLDQTTIRTLLAAAVRAPTAVHLEPWTFAILQDTTALKRLSDRAKPLFLEEVERADLDRGGHAVDIFASPEFNMFYNAGTLIIICGKAMGPFVVADCWLAAENLILAACLFDGTRHLRDRRRGPGAEYSQHQSRSWDSGSGNSPCADHRGVPSGETPPTARKEPEILFWR